MRRSFLAISLGLGLILAACTSRSPVTKPSLPSDRMHQLEVPAGFSVQIFASGLDGPRHLAQGPDGAIYVAEKNANRVSRLPDTDSDGIADAVEPFVTGLPLAHSVEWHKGALYVGATDGVYRFTPTAVPGEQGERIVTLPARGGHVTRTARFGPDGNLYVSVGSTCNVCIEEDPRRAAIWVYEPDGSSGRLFARGLRNTVDFAFQPQTGEIFGVDNGRDNLGDDTPPEELNLISDGGHYGWPECHGVNIVDPKFGNSGSCDDKIPPVLSMQAHSAPLGVAFYTASAFPEPFRGNLFVTFHGSWNRSEKTGYKVVRIPFDDGRPIGPPVDFLTGWLSDSEVWGRPVGLLQTRDGALLISDDLGGTIYRVFFSDDGSP